MELLDRRAVKANMAYKDMIIADLARMLDISTRACNDKINGIRAFNEKELNVLLNNFGKSIFFPKGRYEKRSTKEVEKNKCLSKRKKLYC